VLIGKMFRMHTQVLGIEPIDARTGAVLVPARAVVRVTADPSPLDERMVELLWEERVVMVFRMDVLERAAEVQTRAV